MTDFTFMKSGFDNLENNDREKTLQNVSSIMVHFTENALNTANIYTKHAGRKIVSIEDIKRSMMLEIFFFQKRGGIADKINKIRKDLFENMSDDSDSDCDDINEIIKNEYEEGEYDGDEDNFTESTCECSLCNCINNIYERWENWEPETPIQLILKNRITEM